MVEPSVSPLTLAIEQELTTLEQFCQLLADEQNHLLLGQTTPLAALAEEKSRLAAQLIQHCTQRRALAPETLPPSQSQRLERLRTRASEAELMNRTNGELIQIRLRHNQQALNILQQATHQAMLYGPDGHTQTNLGGGRPLAQG